MPTRDTDHVVNKSATPSSGWYAQSDGTLVHDPERYKSEFEQAAFRAEIREALEGSASALYCQAALSDWMETVLSSDTPEWKETIIHEEVGRFLIGDDDREEEA